MLKLALKPIAALRARSSLRGDLWVVKIGKMARVRSLTVWTKETDITRQEKVLDDITRAARSAGVGAVILDLDTADGLLVTVGVRDLASAEKLRAQILQE